MALRIAHGAFACLREVRARPPAAARLLASRSCQGAEQPPCPPCPPAPRPPCRARPATTLRATRRVCCPPPAGSPPPCPPPPCAPPLTCEDAQSGKRNMSLTSEGCGTAQDRVARRLALAKEQRRLDYEREVAARPSTYASQPPPAPYTLGEERECARATDGRNYIVKCGRTPPASCGPNRTPPPPRCVELMRDTECAIRNNAYLDPCAHVPRTIIDVDRSTSRVVSSPPLCKPSTSPASPLKKPASRGQSPPVKNLTSRIMEKFNLTRNSGGSCPRTINESKCETTGARRAGDSDWCQTQPKPTEVPQCCREPTTMEKIKRRGPSQCTRGKGGVGGKRSFHTSANNLATAARENCKKTSDASATTAKGTTDAESLKNTLKERENLHETGRGRIVTNVRKSPQNFTSGRLDIPVPSGTQNVRVQVSLDGTQTCHKSKSEASMATVNCSPSDNAATLLSSKSKTETWLSFKNLHKKLANYRKNDNVKEVKNTLATCPRPQPTIENPSGSCKPCDPCGAPPPKGNPCKPQDPCKPKDPCKPQEIKKPVDPCKPQEIKKPVDPSKPREPNKPRDPCKQQAPSAPSPLPRRTCPTHGRPTVKKQFSSSTDSLITETLLIKC